MVDILDKSRATVRESLPVADWTALVDANGDALVEGMFVTVEGDGNNGIQVDVIDNATYSTGYDGNVENLYMLLEDADASSVRVSGSIGVARVSRGFLAEVEVFNNEGNADDLTGHTVMGTVAVDDDGRLAFNDGVQTTGATLIGTLYKVPTDGEDTAIFVTV